MTAHDKMALIESIIQTNVNKHGLVHTTGAVNNYLASGNRKNFTQTNNTRENIKLISTAELTNIIQNHSGMAHVDDVSNLVASFVSKMVKPPDYLKKACEATLTKYGINQTITAIEEYAQRGYPKHFTNTNDARKELINNVQPNQIYDRIVNYLAETGITLTNLDFRALVIQYIDIVLKNMTQNSSKATVL
jgi:hypothetical protein